MNLFFFLHFVINHYCFFNALQLTRDNNEHNAYNVYIMFHIDYGGRRDRMEVGFTTTYTLSSYQTK